VSAYEYFVLSIANYIIAKPELFTTTAILVILTREAATLTRDIFKRSISSEMEPIAEPAAHSVVDVTGLIIARFYVRSLLLIPAELLSE
jgi:hypothetical protein